MSNTRIIRQPEDSAKLAAYVSAQGKFPLMVTITVGDARRPRQNRLAQRWFTDIARQRGDTTHDEVRAECKRQFGVPILLAENEAFTASWDRHMGRYTYEDQVDAIRDFDLPVTRMMTVKQMTDFMDAMQRHWGGLGFRLTDPEALKWEEEFS